MSRGALWTGRVLSALGVLFLTFDAVIKVTRLDSVAPHRPASSATLGR